MLMRNVIFWLGLLVGIAAILVLLNPILPPFVAGLALAYLLSGALTFIPYVGVVVGTATGVLIATFQYDEWPMVAVYAGMPAEADDRKMKARRP